MKGKLTKLYSGWVVTYVEDFDSKILPYSGSVSIPVHPYDKVNDDDEGGEVEFKIVYFWETGMEEPFKVAELFKPVKPKKINLEEMPKEEWEESRNPAYKHFDINLEYPELNQTGTIKIYEKKFEIDFSKVTTLEDVVLILKGMDLSVHWYTDTCPEQFQELYEKGFLKEINNDKL